MQATDPGAAAVVIPVKAFSRAKARLAGVLSPEERNALAQSMATTVVRAAAPLAVVVVCDDPDVRTWAEGLGVEVLWTPGLGLNGAVAAGADHVAGRGWPRVVVAHADLPRATDLSVVLHGPAVTIVPDRHGDGTNVIAVPTGAGFRFAYGAGSCGRHVAEAQRLGLALRVLEDEALGWDVDRPEDLEPCR